MPWISANVHTFGYGHGPAPSAPITLDVRTLLRNPHADPAMRNLTGRDPAVREHVLNTPNARELVNATAERVRYLLTDGNHPRGILVRVAVGCAGGRHRAPVLGEAIAAELERMGIGVEVFHRDIDKPVL
ncbi:ATPase [Plantactinospora sp. S1510]|uniref:ATPase n=1 Tax=Plantactinospora alkalitolerans TaxID=2789879 RepID=A0ABS0HAJ8_9ACTN|nr:RNase adapter RapZ [Plantactinospora alkalitolerans]MBF9135218.1 ATPase [Plantactinospora alkalitolerans]